MRPTERLEIVFEGSLEARVAAQLLTDAGRTDLLESITPPIDPPTIGRKEFVAKLAKEQKGRGDNTEYTCAAATSLEVAKTLGAATKLTSPGQPPLNRRKKYMGQKIVEFISKCNQLAAALPKTNTVESEA